jgi:protein SCO1/2
MMEGKVARRLLTLTLILTAVAVSYSQMKALTEIGIDEKLGSSVDLDAVLRDETGKQVTLRQYVDKPTILMFNYFRCPGICPVLISNMVQVVNQMQLEPGKDYRLIAVSFDPTDTPQMAAEKKANYLNQMRRPFSPGDWHFLTGDAKNTRAVADSTGFKYQRKGDMYVHPGAIMVLTPRGILSRYIYGTTFVPADVEIAVKQAAEGAVLPTISKALAFCYTYDPEGRQYVFSVTRLVGTATLVLAVIFIIFVVRGKVKKQKQEVRS